MYSEKNRSGSEVQAKPDRLNPWTVGSALIGIVSVHMFVILGAIWLVPFGVGAGHIGLQQQTPAQGKRGLRLAYAGLALGYGLSVLALIEAILFYVVPGWPFWRFPQ